MHVGTAQSSCPSAFDRQGWYVSGLCDAVVVGFSFMCHSSLSSSCYFIDCCIFIFFVCRFVGYLCWCHNFLLCLFCLHAVFWQFFFLSPNSTSRDNSMAVNYSIGTFFGCCFIASSNCLSASIIILAGLSCGIVMAWCLNLTVYGIHSAPVDCRTPFNVR